LTPGDPADLVSRAERPFASRVLRLATNGKVPANAKVLNERGPSETIYFGAMVLIGMVFAGAGVLAIAAITAAAFAASGHVYGWVVGLVGLVLVPLLLCFVLRMMQFLKASKNFRLVSS
jgi:hypothetical protein